MKEITLEDIRNGIKNIFNQLYEIEFVEDVDTNITMSDIESVGEKIASEKIVTEHLNNLIARIIRGEQVKMTMDYAYPTKLNLFNYVTTVLANLYKNANETTKINIRNYMLYAYLPRSKNSIFLKLVGNEAGVPNINTLNKDSNVFDVILDETYQSIIDALELYDPAKKVEFSTFLSVRAKTEVLHELQRIRGYHKGGERVYTKTFSLDEPFGSEEEGQKQTFADFLEEPSFGEREEEETKREIAQAVNSFVKTKILTKAPEIWNDVYNMIIIGYKSAQIADDLGESPGNIRVIKNRLAAKIDNSVKDGTMKSYVMNKTGHNIESYKKIMDVLNGGKFIFTPASLIIKEDLLKEFEKNIILTEIKKFIKNIFLG